MYKIPNYERESVRQTDGGGSILTGLHCDLSPVLVSDGAHDDIEILVGEGDIWGIKCRFINGHGPQESADVNKRTNLFGILSRNNMIVCNGSDLCLGLFTRTK